MGRSKRNVHRKKFIRAGIFPRHRKTAGEKVAFLGVNLAVLLFLLVILPALWESAAKPSGAGEEQGQGRLPQCLPVEEDVTLQIYSTETGEMVEMELEAYVAGVVAAEMPSSFHNEALKAQAVAARTYALQKARGQGGPGCAGRDGADLCTDGTCCQAWRHDAAKAMLPGGGGKVSFLRSRTEPAEAERWGKICAAVEATRGLVLCHNGALIQAVYHSTCGGMTAAASEVWQEDLPYLQPVDDPYCRHSPYYRQEVHLGLPTFLAALTGPGQDGAAFVLAGRESLLEVSRRGQSGRNIELRLQSTLSGHPLSGSEFRRRLGLPSTYFQWKIEGNEIIFFTRGYGHGVGLCQYGADGMGRAGKNFQEILAHYYQGVEVNTYRRSGGSPPR